MRVAKCLLGKVAKATKCMLHAATCWKILGIKDDASEPGPESGHMAEFLLLLENLNLAALLEYPSSVRQTQKCSSHQYDVIPWEFHCRVHSPRLYRSFKILSPLMFGDGTR